MSKAEIFMHLTYLSVISVISYLYFRERLYRKKYAALYQKSEIKYNLIMYKYLTLDTYKAIHFIIKYMNTLKRLNQEKPIE